MTYGESCGVANVRKVSDILNYYCFTLCHVLQSFLELYILTNISLFTGKTILIHNVWFKPSVGKIL